MQTFSELDTFVVNFSWWSICLLLIDAIIIHKHIHTLRYYGAMTMRLLKIFLTECIAMNFLFNAENAMDTQSPQREKGFYWQYTQTLLLPL
jgi:hypothetical protein